MYLLELVCSGSVLIKVLRTENKAMIVFDFDKVICSFVGGFNRSCFSREVNVEVVEEVWVFETNVGYDIEKHDRMENFDEVLLYGLLDMNNNSIVQFNQVSPELKSLHNQWISSLCNVQAEFDCEFDHVFAAASGGGEIKTQWLTLLLSRICKKRVRLGSTPRRAGTAENRIE
jgi:hypothetical protein